MSDQLLPNLFRSEYRRLVSLLTNRYGYDQIPLVEDAVGETFMLAAETWGKQGLPENPQAWLFTAAKNRVLDQLRRKNTIDKKVVRAIQPLSVAEEIKPFDHQRDMDSQIQMMFAIANPILSFDEQIGLGLRILCGFGNEEIASALLVNKEAINKRLYRAREKLRTLQRDEIIKANENESRLETVLTLLYLLFNKGYYDRVAHKTLHRDICFEAIHLCWLLRTSYQKPRSEIPALLALMCFHASRFEARNSESGEEILYEDQNRDLWDDGLAQQGFQFLNEASTGEHLTRFHLEAAIAALHCEKEERENKWRKILDYYNLLLQIHYSPVAALNRTFAYSKVFGKEQAYVLAKEIELKEYLPYPLLLAYLIEDTDPISALGHLEEARILAVSTDQKNKISQRIDLIKTKMKS
jgi:RNA polymerase sigma-70 factor (ECF subfamily)